jgi:hypothetical protein
MSLPVPSQDQVMGQLRAIIPALGTIVSALGVSGATANHYVDLALAMVGPIAYFVVAIWSLIANTQAAKIKTVQDIATGPASNAAVDAQHAIINAASAIASDRTIPASQTAANVLVAATAALPQVQTIVTDKRTADASPSPSVIPAQAA